VSSDLEPLYISDPTRSIFTLSVVFGSILLGTGIAEAYFALVFSAVDLPLTSGFLVVGCALYAFAFYGYWAGRRVEFYEDFARMFKKRKKQGIDVRYSDLKFTWQAVNGRTVCWLTIKDNIIALNNLKKRGNSWMVMNVNGKNRNAPLYMWLQSKNEAA